VEASFLQARPLGEWESERVTMERSPREQVRRSARVPRRSGRVQQRSTETNTNPRRSGRALQARTSVRAMVLGLPLALRRSVERWALLLLRETPVEVPALPMAVEAADPE